MKKAKLPFIIFSLILLAVLLFPLPALAAVTLSATQGNVGSIITVSGLSSGTYTIVWDSTTLSSGTVPSSGTVTFNVPETPGGLHTVKVENPTGTEVLSTSFTVLPSISISPDNGTVGTSVTVSGKGFASSESAIKVIYNTSEMLTGISASSVGSWSATFNIPASKRGTNTIDASGNSTPATSVTDVNFTVKPAISVTPVSGAVGTTVTVKGTGFAGSETGLKITFDTTEVKTGISADASGSWNTTFEVPMTHSGAHTIDASGGTTAASEVADVSFSVMSGISIDKTTGYVGDTVTVTGTGFGANEVNVVVLFDGAVISTPLAADATGYWKTTFTVPPAVNGTHSVDAQGSLTPSTSITDKNFSVQAKLVLNPTSGNVGDTISISGQGFSASKAVNITFGTVTIDLTMNTDGKGSFSGSFTAPKGISGEVNVTAKDAGNISASAKFEMDKTAPPVPKVKSPRENSTIGFVGGSRVNFVWEPVSDPSGVTYDIHVATDEEFLGIVLEKYNLTKTEYMSEKDETLPQGNYYWRIRAVDYATNASKWSEPVKFKVGFMSLTTLLIIVAVLVVILIIYLRARAVFRK